MEYNSQRGQLLMKEYGRYIQRMVQTIVQLEDKEKQLQQAKATVEAMAVLNPGIKMTEEWRQTLWDHLQAMAGFQLQMEAPFPLPEKEDYQSKPEKLPYPKRYPKYSHLGKNLELVVAKALEEEDPEKKTGFANAIAYYMKLSYSNWHKELVPDDVIRTELDEMTDGSLNFSNTPYIKHRTQHQGFEDEYSTAGRNGRRNYRGGGGGARQQVQGGNRIGGRPTGGGGGGNRGPRQQGGGGFKKRYK